MYLRYYVFIVSLVATLVAPTELRAASLTKEVALLHLDSIGTAIAEIPSLGLHDQDRARFQLLARTVDETRSTINHLGLAHQDSIHHFQQLFSRFKYSSQFFEFCRTKRNEASIRRVLDTIALLQSDLGLNGNPYSLVLRSHLDQLTRSIQALKNLEEVDNSLRNELQALLPDLGDALAAASQGDSPDPRLRKLCANLYALICKLYPKLNKLADHAAAFGIISEIMGINEFIGEATRADDEK